MNGIHNPLRLNDPSLFIQQPWLGSGWVQLTDRDTFVVTNPADGQVLGMCADMTAQDTKEAIARADVAFNSFSKTTPQFRADLLLRFFNLMVDNAEDLARLITWENGKSLTDARAEVKYAASYLQWYSGEALRMYGRTIPSSLPGSRNFTILQPIGVVGLLLPWNFPLGMVCRKIGPALAVGCTTVLKIPSETPFSCLALIELARRAGIPSDVINVVSTERHLHEVGLELCENPLVKKISFTGSTRVGKILMKQCSGTLKKLSMELGGNAPFIVFDDADLHAAVAGAVASKFRGGGQTCVCAQRLYVQEGIYPAFAEAMTIAVKELKLGNGFEDGVTMGPLIHERAVAKCEEHVNDAVGRGANVLVGGKGLGGCFYPPTLLGDAPNDCLLTDEETFGPVAALIKFKTESEVINLANASNVGLAGYFFSENADRIWRVADALKTGMVGANTGIISQAVVPFGGIRESGWGKEGGSEGMSDFCIQKMVCIGSTSAMA